MGAPAEAAAANPQEQGTFTRGRAGAPSKHAERRRPRSGWRGPLRRGGPAAGAARAFRGSPLEGNVDPPAASFRAWAPRPLPREGPGRSRRAARSDLASRLGARLRAATSSRAVRAAGLLLRPGWQGLGAA